MSDTSSSDQAEVLRRRQDDEAAQCAALCFDPAERERRLAAVGRAPDDRFAVLARNQLVPLTAVPGSGVALCRRAEGDALDEGEQRALNEHAHELDLAVDAATGELRGGGSHEQVKAACRTRASWPAVGLAESEEELRQLLSLQFERMRADGVAWRGMGGGIFSVPTPGGMVLLIDFYWRAPA